MVRVHAGPSARASEARQAAVVLGWPLSAPPAIAAGAHAATAARMAAGPPHQALLTEQQPCGAPQRQRQAPGGHLRCLRTPS